MKFLDNVELESLVLKLSKASRRYALEVCLESYSCKMVTEEKRNFKQLRARLEEEGLQESCLNLSPSLTFKGMESLSGERPDYDKYVMSDYQAELDTNPQSQSRSRNPSISSAGHSESAAKSGPTITAKELFCLQVTLEQAFNSYFLDTSSEDFALEPELMIVKRYIAQFCSVYVDKYEQYSSDLWTHIDQEIHPNRCIIYSYKPDRSREPYDTRYMSQFNYFFFNRSLKRVLFFSMIVRDSPPEDAYDEEEMEDIF
ncbi:unnamed protein product [Rodentolepis nana]|uniref:Repressor of RNA polymerase III transcription MAF1 homolog n=1 Tax=Rodentolepis nana TaxID=102285 RepID=A0A0R3TVS3_RODNA|nr:unnamed protein product [Rodentolepis nana]